MLDIIIISYNGRNLTVNCINSILDSYFYKYIDNIKITIVDNNSSDDTIEYISKHYPEIEIIKNKENLGYSAAVNIGMKNTKNDYVIITNNDVVFTEHSIDILLTSIKNIPKAGLIGPQQFYPNGKWQRSYGDFSGIKCGLKYLFCITLIVNIFNKYFYNINNKNRKRKKVEYIDGATLLVSRKIFNVIDGFDEDYFFYGEDMDFSYKLKIRNYNRYIIPKAIVYHHRGGSDIKKTFTKEKQELLIDAKILFCNKHLNLINKKLYIILEKLHHITMLYFFSFLIKIKNTEQIKNKQNYYKIMSDIWLKK